MMLASFDRETNDRTVSRFDVGIYDKQSVGEPTGGAVLLYTPVLLILKHYNMVST
jgi:hypothetical protein